MGHVWFAYLFLQCLMLCSGEDNPWTDVEQIYIPTQPELPYGAFPDGDYSQRNPRMKRLGPPRDNDGYRFQDTSCLNQPGFSRNSFAVMLLDLMKNLEGGEHTTIAKFLQAANRAGLNPDQFEDKEGELPARMEDQNTFAKLVMVMWLASNDQVSLEKTGWCTLDQISQHVSSSSAAQIARVLDIVVPTLSSGRQILDNFALSLQKPWALRRRTSTVNSRIMVIPPDSNKRATFDDSMTMTAVETITPAVKESSLKKNMGQEVRILMDEFMSEFERNADEIGHVRSTTEATVPNLLRETVTEGTVKDGTVLEGTVNDGKVIKGIVKDGPIIMKDETILDEIVKDGILINETMKEANDGIVKTKPVKKETHYDDWSQLDLHGLTQYRNSSPGNRKFRNVFCLRYIIFCLLYFLNGLRWFYLLLRLSQQC